VVVLLAVIASVLIVVAQNTDSLPLVAVNVAPPSPPPTTAAPAPLLQPQEPATTARPVTAPPDTQPPQTAPPQTQPPPVQQVPQTPEAVAAQFGGTPSQWSKCDEFNRCTGESGWVYRSFGATPLGFTVPDGCRVDTPDGQFFGGREVSATDLTIWWLPR